MMVNSRIASRVRLVISTLANVTGAITIELRRLNRARIDSTALASMQPRDRRKAVKAALTAHHRNSSRCC
ncbi:MAG: hypothetical protein WAU82_23960 [Candidatus Binatus sp.]|uniref:hypothetical protein n=1 Tax=Candidatus Binatus sp. TaxID=2811406 RepID=UPI003BB035B4